MILLLSPQPWMALPVCLQLPTLLLLPSLSFCSPPDHPFSLLSWLHPSRLPGSFFLLLLLNFSHPDGYFISPSHSRCGSGCVCCPCQFSGWDPALWAGLCPISHCHSPSWSNPATKPWLLARTRKPHGAPVLAMPGSPCAVFSSLIFFVSQDLMHYSVLWTLRGVGKIMVLQRARAHPGNAGFCCHGLISPSSIKPGIVLTTQEVPPSR